MPPGERPKIARVTDDVFAAVIQTFMASSKFKAYSDATQEVWGRELRLAMRPDTLGSISVYTMRPALLQAFLDGLAGRPGKQAAALAALKQLEKWAIVRDLLPRSITTAVEIEESDGGHLPWSEDQVALAEREARSDLGKVVTLAANTGQRGSDLVRMGWSDIERYNGLDGINVTQKKTKRQIWVPITAELAVALAGWERRPGPILTRQDGIAWTRKALSNAWTYERDTNAASERYRLGYSWAQGNGLRPVVARRRYDSSDERHGWHVRRDGRPLLPIQRSEGKCERRGPAFG